MPGIGNCLDTSDGESPLPTYLVPWFFTASRPESLGSNWATLADSSQVGKRTRNEKFLTKELPGIYS